MGDIAADAAIKEDGVVRCVGRWGQKLDYASQGMQTNTSESCYLSFTSKDTIKLNIQNDKWCDVVLFYLDIQLLSHNCCACPRLPPRSNCYVLFFFIRPIIARSSLGGGLVLPFLSFFTLYQKQFSNHSRTWKNNVNPARGHVPGVYN